MLLFKISFQNKLPPFVIEPLTIFKTGFDFWRNYEPCKDVATIETLIFPFMLSSFMAPKINSASGSTSALILFTALHLLQKVLYRFLL